jgi:glycylpeptide N-tetradecanoyltransferase
MEEKDVPAVHGLWQKFMTHFDMVPAVTKEEVQHYLLSGRGEGEAKNWRREGQVVWSYVVEVSLSFRIRPREAQHLIRRIRVRI